MGVKVRERKPGKGGVMEGDVNYESKAEIRGVKISPILWRPRRPDDNPSLSPSVNSW